MKAAMRPFLALFPALLLCACASTGTYPSLERRPGERITGTAEPAPAETRPAPDPAAVSGDLKARLAALVERARAAHATFMTKRPRAETLAVGAPRGSEGWAVATVAVSELESARSNVMIALADLDAMHVAERTANPNAVTNEAAAISEARDTVMALVASEDEVLARLRGRV